MKALLALVPLTIFALASCGSESTGPSAGVGPGLHPAPSATASGSEPLGPAKTCKPTCSTAADCATPGEPLLDTAHHACQAGRCQWLGCQSDAECTSALGTNKVACREEPGAPMKSCVPTCNAAADCAVPGSAMTDAAHFSCNEGTCAWRGCASNSECTSSLMSGRFVCERAAGAEIPSCQPTCNTAADCAVPGSAMTSANHFACVDKRCRWLGCKSTAECANELRVSNVVCE